MKCITTPGRLPLQWSLKSSRFSPTPMHPLYPNSPHHLLSGHLVSSCPLCPLLPMVYSLHSSQSDFSENVNQIVLLHGLNLPIVPIAPRIKTAALPWPRRPCVWVLSTLQIHQVPSQGPSDPVLLCPHHSTPLMTWGLCTH